MSTYRRRAGTMLVSAAALLTWAATPAAANPPTLQAVGASGGIATAQWTLPPNVRAEFFVVSNYPDVNAYGYFTCNGALRGREFCASNPAVERFGVLAADQTSLTSSDAKPALEPGTYYVHIAGHDPVHRGCPQIEFSQTFEVTIDAAGNGISGGIVGPGTGPCTLAAVAGGAGGAGGGSAGGGQAVPGDKTAPTTQLRYPRKQDLDKLAVRARMSEPGTLTARALVDVGGLLAKIYTFKPAIRKVSGGLLVRLKPKISKRKKGALKRAMRRGKRLRARVTITAVDRAGNTTTKHALIRLKP